MLSDVELIELEELQREVEIEDSRESILNFTSFTFKKFKPVWFHLKYYEILDKFCKKEIKNLIISMPPQHGKSEGSSRRTPAYICGKRPDDKIALVCYAATKAQKFGREVISIMREKEYQEIFPDVKYPERGYTGAKANTNENRESINSDGSMKFVGVGGPLTGDPVDVMIMDDLYKDWKEGSSPVVREAVWDWYTSVAETRLHNDSQQLIVFTRWNEDDLVGRLEDKGKVIEWKDDESIDELLSKIEHDQFLKINFPAIKEEGPSDFDPRVEGEALWEEKHSKRKLESSRDKDELKFECLYQGKPGGKEGMLYLNPFKTWKSLPKLKIVKSYTDTADTGDDYLCSIVYGVPLDDNDENIYVLDWIYTQDPMEITEQLQADLLKNNKVNIADIESNNGGRAFARAVEKILKAEGIKNINIEWFHQGGNKESRIYSQSSTVNRRILFPYGWHKKDKVFYKHITKFKKLFIANTHDDAPDTLTGVVEKADVIIQNHSTDKEQIKKITGLW